MTQATTTRRQIIRAHRTRDHIAYMIVTGAPMDSIVCRACIDTTEIGWAPKAMLRGATKAGYVYVFATDDRVTI